MPSPIAPFSPPRSCPLAPVSGRVGGDPAHFYVEEIPAYPLSGSGEHVFLFVEKTSLNTTDVAKRIAQATGIKERDIGYAGMKDKHAVTRQWFSFVYRKDDAAALDLGEGARIIEATRHNNKLRTGHLIGNHFALTFVNCADGDAEKAQAMVEWLTQHGMPNYFGPQRFGHGGRNLAQAYAWLEQAVAAADERPNDASVESSEKPRHDRRDRRKGGKAKGGRFENKLHPTVIQSEFFNRYLHARLADPAPLLQGEVVRLDKTNSHFVVEDLTQELPRRNAGDLLLSGELPGAKTVHANGNARLLEQRILAEMGISDAQLQVLLKSAPGARRDLCVQPEALRLETGASPDELILRFALPSGCFATQLAYELSACDWSAPRLTPARPSSDES